MRYLVPLVLLIVASGCGSLQRPVSSVPGPVDAPVAPRRPAPREPWARPAPLVTVEPTFRQPAADASPDARRAVDVARSLLRTPYRYGGNGRRGIDCSGLTTYVYRRLGIELPRTAAAQAGVGEWVAPDELRAGDLVFFGHSRDKPFHVGLVVSPPGWPLEMIHASTKQGVIETNVSSSDYWLHRFKFGRRVLPAPRALRE